MPGSRRNAAALIDDTLLIDPGPDVPEALETFGKAKENIRYIINTHTHSDHYSEATLAFLPNAVFTELKAGEECQLGPWVCRWCISHMARTLHTAHEELAQKMAVHNIEVAYDGYETVL